ncbi:MAG: hypothetical protein RMM30_04965, partial [Armatimonadota bacterium]|nr:hypothetical protein [Armatimonadota bacterium]MDW8155919.1 hypothetical protein [Armatimonadota bacterium]
WKRAAAVWLGAVLCGLSVGTAGRTGTAEVAPPEYFGYNSARAEGERPLLVVLVEYEDVRFQVPRDELERLVFGPGYPNIVDYYRSMSAGLFTWARAGGGVVGPLRLRDLPGTRWNEALFACWWGIVNACPERPADQRELEELFVEEAVAAAFSAGFDFHAFDRNRDRRLTIDELGVLVVGAAPERRITPGPNGRLETRPVGDDVVVGAEVLPGPNGRLDTPPPEPRRESRRGAGDQVDDQVVWGDGAAARRTCDRRTLAGRTGTLRLCLRIASVTEWASVSSVAHELYHVLSDRNWDLYGALARLNTRMTLMAATIFGRTGDRRTFQLDPFHKMQSGWVRPRVLRMPRRTAQCEPLDLRNRLIVYDPERSSSAMEMDSQGLNLGTVTRTKEYFIFELRVRAPGAYDGDIPEEGVAVWYVQTTADNRPLVIPGAIVMGPNMQLDSRPAGDDVVDPPSPGPGTAVRIGRNQRLETVRGGDDRYQGDHAVWLISAREDPLDGRRGGTALWTLAHEEFELRWLDGTSTGLRFLVGPALAGGVVREVEFNPGALRIDRIAPSSGEPGSEVTLEGHFGARRAAKVVGMNHVGGGSYTMEVVSWSCSQIRARVPRNAPLGEYRVVVYQDGTRAVGSLPVAFWVRSAVRVEPPSLPATPTVPGTIPTPAGPPSPGR